MTGRSRDNWYPSAAVETLRLRASVLSRIRAFFSKRGILEVETGALGRSASGHGEVGLFVTQWRTGGQIEVRNLFLQTSPEAAMKRLLAAGTGSIYQMS
jgi:lysyl-tRNA synthetase class 2